MNPLTLQSFLNSSMTRLSELTDRPAHEARILAAQVCLQTTEWVFAHPEHVLTSSQCNVLEILLKRRLLGEPLAKVIGKKAFWKETFFTNEHTLDPRPESELIIEAASTHCCNEPHYILELGVGSGCLILSLLQEFSAALGVGVDLSWEALQVANKNAKHLSLTQKINFIQGQWFGAINSLPTFDLIISNPPYISSHILPKLPSEVYNYDPHLALDGGLDGVAPYSHFVEQKIDRLLRPGGLLIMEIGQGQEVSILEIFQSTPLTHIDTLKDLQKIPRVLIFKKENQKDNT